ncbi:hypothetical protein D9613_000172 [Agrocybe pediades]|uniref:AB hydrolase-1 domain-containing protein n=1 Tax=Agrocybe pediades TaxID=84607 RepID=A0A8H4QZK5_9AGAR|nr:hypothetical protein D9613_000172 [Agrocybe pediades]
MDPLTAKPHYPYPSGPIRGQPTVNPRRRLAPLLESSQLVPLPNPLPPNLNRKCAFTPTHTVSVHVLPAAFPRAPSTPGQVELPPAESFKSKDDRKKFINNLVQKLVWEKQQLESGSPDPSIKQEVSEVGLWNTALRIRRNESTVDGGSNAKGITLIAAHPIGFHKEIFEPIFKRLIEQTEQPSSTIRIEEIWSIEGISHGDAALINGRHLPRIPDRSDYGRDIANFLIHYLPEGTDAFGKDLPLTLGRVSEAISSARVKNGYPDRHVVAFGHSLGGDASAMCGIHYPKLFSAIVLSETTLFPAVFNLSRVGPALSLGAMGRRSSWPSRAEARDTLSKSLRTLDPACIDVYVQYGLVEDPQTGVVSLKCTPEREAVEYMSRRIMNETWELLPTLDESIPLRWVMGGRDDASALVGGPEASRITVWRRPRNTSNVKIPGGGHLVVQERPKEVGEDLALFLTSLFGSSPSEKSKL